MTLNKNVPRHLIYGWLFSTCLLVTAPMADETSLIIDDRSSVHDSSVGDAGWRLVTDNVMGGVSNGELSAELIDGRSCLRLQGEVRMENKGGFIQAALDLPAERLRDASAYEGIVIDVYGNGEVYNLHLRQDGLWLPWQAFRSSFEAPPEWRTVYLPFTTFKPHATRAGLKPDRLKRIGLVAIGRPFSADICLARIGYYRAQ